MSNQYADLVRQMQGIAQRAVPSVDWLDKGHLQPDGSLKVDRFAQAFKLGTYYQLMPLLLPDPMVTTNSVSVGDHGSHSHIVPRPIEFTPPQVGTSTDVLVAFIDGGNTPVIIGIIRRVE